MAAADSSQAAPRPANRSILSHRLDEIGAARRAQTGNAGRSAGSASTDRRGPPRSAVIAGNCQICCAKLAHALCSPALSELRRFRRSNSLGHRWNAFPSSSASAGGAGARATHTRSSARQLVLRQAKRLPHQPLPAIALDGVANSPRNGQPQPRMANVVRRAVQRRARHSPPSSAPRTRVRIRLPATDAAASEIG